MRILSALSLLFALTWQLAPRPAQLPSATSVAVTGVTVIDMTGAPPRREMTVVISGDRIAAMGTKGKVWIPRAAQVVDGRGKFLIPGLWDMHVHLSEEKTPLPMFIAAGVLGVRHMGGNVKQVVQWRDGIRRGKVLGPRIIVGQMINGPDAPASVSQVRNESDGRRAVNLLRGEGVDFIKVYDGVPRDAYFAIAGEAKKKGIPFAGHVPPAITDFDASDAGQKSIEHTGNALRSSSSLEPEVIEQRVKAIVKPSGKPNDYSAIPARIAERTKIELDTYSERRARQLFARFVKNGTFQVPTLTVKRSISFIDDGIFAGDPRLKYVPQAERSRWESKDSFLLKYRTPEYIRVRKLLFQKEMDLVREMHRAGVKFMTGTDIPGAYMYTGFSLHDELSLLVRAGFTPMEALQAATRRPAEFLGELKSSGTIERGKAANLVLLDADPLDDIDNTKRIDAVILNGRYLPKEDLQKMLADVEAAAQKS